MIRLIKICCAVAAVMLLSSAALEKGKDKPVYMFGVSASFLDTLVYITDIHAIDSIKLEKDILPQWGEYSYQLKYYMEQKEGMQNRTPMIYYSGSRKKLEKDALKLKKKYQKSGIVIKPIPAEKFKFSRIKSD